MKLRYGFLQKLKVYETLLIYGQIWDVNALFFQLTAGVKNTFMFNLGRYYVVLVTVKSWHSFQQGIIALGCSFHK